MDEGQSLGHEGDLLVGQGKRGAIAEVAQYGMPQLGHLDPYLVVPAGFQLDLHQAAGGRSIEHAISQACFLCLVCGPGVDDTGAFRASFDVMDQSPRGFLQVSLNDCQIALLNRSGAELFAQASGGFGRPPEEKSSRYRPVEAVDQGQKYLSWFLTANFEPGFGQVQE